MKRLVSLWVLLALLLCSCSYVPGKIISDDEPSEESTQDGQTTVPESPEEPTESSGDTNTLPTDTEPPLTDPPVTEPPVTEPPATEPPVTQPEHSGLYIPDVSVEDVIRYFNEVSLDAEFSSSGDATKVQKWDVPIVYTIHGQPTEADLAVLDTYTRWLNTIEGFPGIREASDPGETNLDIHFCSYSQMINILGTNFYGCDGGVTFWYRSNRIYQETICIRTDIGQDARNSVILEEIYNGLGPVQDTDLRKDSIIYSGYSIPQSLTAVDELILKLLYHPEIQFGMDNEQCEEVIRRLYY